MKSTFQRKLVLAAAMTLGTGSAWATPGDDYPGWGFFFGGENFAAFDLGGNDNDTAVDSVVGEDGSMYVAGTVTDAQGLPRIGVAKFGPDGILDNTFSGDGKNTTLIANVRATSIAITETRVYVAGFTTNNAPDFDMVVCQFVRSNGTNIFFPDNNNSSCVKPDAFPGTQDIARDIAVQSDGKIVIAGTVGVNNPGDTMAAFARFHSNGQKDTSFGNLGNSNLGLFRTDGIYVSHQIAGLAIGSNGQIIGVGHSVVQGGTDLTALVMRLDENGSDAQEFSFAKDNSNSRDTVLNAVVPVDDPNSLNDFLIVGGTVELTGGNNSGFIAKVNSNTDAFVGSFGEDDAENITVITPPVSEDLEFTDLAIEPDGSIVALGLHRAVTDDLWVRRFTANGGNDTMFGNNGLVAIDFGLPGEFQEPAGISAKGDALYIAGWAARNGDTSNIDFVVAKRVSGSPVEPEDFFADGFKDGFED